ncbi:hypothetical protein L9F63_011821, partial [Diploptera punctata]
SSEVRRQHHLSLIEATGGISKQCLENQVQENLNRENLTKVSTLLLQARHDITIQRLLDDDENPNCQQVRRKTRNIMTSALPHKPPSIFIPG